MFIQGHALVHVFIPGWHILNKSTYLSCTYQRSLSWVWLVRYLLLSYNLHRPSGVSSIFPCCFVLQGVFHHLGYLLALDYQPYLIWTISWGLRSILEGSLVDQCLWHFRREFQSCWKFFTIFSLQAGAFVPSDLLGGLRSCPHIFDRLDAFLAALLWDLSCPSVLYDDSVSKVFGGILRPVPGNLLPAFFFHCLNMEMVSTGFFPSFRRYFGVSRISSCYMRRIGWIELIEEFDSIVI